MQDETPFASVIEDLKYDPCPKCGSKEIAISQQHSCCLKCGRIGPSIDFVKDNVILKSILTQESFLNLTASHKSSLKSISFGIAREKSFPGADQIQIDKEFGAARCFIAKTDEFGEEVNIPEYLINKTFKSFRLGMFNFLERVSAVAARAIVIDGKNTVKRFTAQRLPTQDQLMGKGDSFLVNDDGSISEEYFRKKTVIDIDSTKSTEEEINIRIYSAAFGRPDTFINSSYNKNSGIIPEKYPSLSISPISTIWQPLYWPALNLDKDVMIRLVGVLQGGSENINYIVTEGMDTGEFNAGIYKRELYNHNVSFIQSKADNVEEAIRRLRTSFEKTVLSHEQNNEPLDISWIKDWNYDATFDSAFYEILSGQFWGEALDCEMLHIIGYTKQQLLEEMYNEVNSDE
jgi:hypothetical protein